MKRMTVGGLLIIGLGASLALGQYYGGAYIDNSASTVGESYARGMADVVRSQGAANVMNSQAAINMTEAARRDMENREQWTDTYFQMRQKNKEYRAAEKRPRATREDWVRYAAAGKPERLSPSELDSVTGKIKWPRVLMRSEFEASRTDLEALFAKRAAYGAGTWDDYSQIATTIKSAEQELKNVVSQVPPQDYTVAKRFLESLSYENRMPAS
ncbi:MAG: hypothetical protein ACOX1P_11625 [Thermoguttaceae bacterium]|jgi:hypothetical protein